MAVDRVIVDAASEESFSHFPLAVRNRELSSRLAQMRQVPCPLQIVLNSGDRPAPFGSSHYSFTYPVALRLPSQNGPSPRRPDGCDQPVRSAATDFRRVKPIRIA